MVETTSSTGGREVIASGIGITYNAESYYDVKLKFEDGFTFTVRFTFGKDSTASSPVLNRSLNASEGIITLECMNFDSFIGTRRPLELAEHDGQKVSINFWVSVSSSGDTREIRYCIYKGNRNEKGK